MPKSANILNPIALSSACIAVAASLRATRCCFGFLALGSVVTELLDLRLLLVLEDSAWNGAFQVLSKISDKPACVAARTPAVVLTHQLLNLSEHVIQIPNGCGNFCVSASVILLKLFSGFPRISSKSMLRTASRMFSRYSENLISSRKLYLPLHLQEVQQLRQLCPLATCGVSTGEGHPVC